MSIFNIITLFGGLAMFLYGMRLMGNSLKESSSGALKKAMESVTNSTIKAMLLGLIVTAIIQSSTATIVITSGLVAAGVITLHQSIGIIIGANVGTTVTGQIIRLLDLNATATEWLQFFKPSTLAPLALIIGIVMIMFLSFRNSEKIGNIAMGFGILFTGLMNMTGSVNALSASGAFDKIFLGLGDNPLVGYLSGAGVAFVLQSSSATIGILQAFASAGQLQFKAIYAVIVGIYLGDCVTTAIVCSIGAKSEAKKVGIVNILFNLSETVLVLLSVTVIHKLGLLDGLWEKTVTSGDVANTNTVFNLGCAILLFPLASFYEKMANRIVKKDKSAAGKYETVLEGLNPVFFNTPALALKAIYDALLTMYGAARQNVERSVGLLASFDEKQFETVREEEDAIDTMADTIGQYMSQLSKHLSQEEHILILDQYYKNNTDFERMSDHAMNIAEFAAAAEHSFSEDAIAELDVLCCLIEEIMSYAEQSFKKRDLDAASHIEPLEQVTDDMVNALNDNHIARLREGRCTVAAGIEFVNVLTELERISDACSNIGVATIARANPQLASQSHEYTSSLHTSKDFNREYQAGHEKYFSQLEALEN